MKRIVAVIAFILISATMIHFCVQRQASAAPAPYFRLVAAEGQGENDNTFYVGRCVRVDIYLNTSIFNTNGADVEINYDNTLAQVVQSNCSTATTSIYSDGLFNAYPGAGNSVTASKIYLSAYNNPGVSTNTAYGLYGHFFLLIAAESADYDLTFQYAPASTVDTNLAETNGDGSDILASVENLELVFASDSDSPDITGQSPVSGAIGVSVSSTVSYNAYDAMSGVNNTTITARMKESGGSYYSQSLAVGTVSSTNQNRYYQYPVTFSPNGSIKTNAGYYVYNTVYTVEAAVFDLASSAHSVTESWSFTTEDDSSAPYLGDMSPANNSTGVSASSNISFRVKDYKSNGGVIPGLGVNTNTISVQIFSSSLGMTAYTCSSSGVTCDNADPNNVLVTINPSVNFAEDETVMVQVDAGDIHSPVNSMVTQSISFFTADTGLPTIGNPSPANNSFGNAVGANVSFQLADTGAGVDISSLQVYLNDTLYTAASPELAFTGDSANYLITINPAADFTNNTAAVVRVAVRDQASVPNYISPNPYTYSFIIGLYASGGRVFTVDLCPACPVCDASPSLPSTANCPVCAGCPDVSAAKAAACKCPVDSFRVEAFKSASSVQGGKANSACAVVISSPVKASAAVAATDKNNTADKKIAVGGDLLKADPLEGGQEKKEFWIALNLINGIRNDGALINLRVADTLVFSGDSNADRGTDMSLIFHNVDNSSELAFHAVIGDQGGFNLEIKTVLADGTYEVSAILATEDGNIERFSLGTMALAVSSVNPVAGKDSSGGAAVDKKIIAMFLAIIVFLIVIMLVWRANAVTLAGVGIVAIFSIFCLVMLNRQAQVPVATLSMEQREFVAQQALAKGAFAALSRETASPIKVAEHRLSDPLTGKPLSGVVVKKGESVVVSDKEGLVSMAAGWSDESVEFYFSDNQSRAIAKLGSLSDKSVSLNAGLIKFMANLSAEYSQNRYRKIYALLCPDMKRLVDEVGFVHNENATLLNRWQKYDIMQQGYDPQMRAEKPLHSGYEKKYQVFSVAYVFYGFDKNGGLATVAERWHFAADGDAWCVLKIDKQ